MNGMLKAKTIVQCLAALISLLLLSACGGGSTPAPTNETLYFVHTDHLGTPAVITNANQQKVWQADKTPFGETTLAVNQIEFNARFPGQYHDAESGLSYNYFRDYDPSLGRYVQSDPIGLAGGMNTYLYVTGNPISRYDYFGLDGSLYPKPLSSADPSDFTLPEQCPDRSCQTIVNRWLISSPEAADTWNQNGAIMSTLVSAAVGSTVTVLTRNAGLGANAASSIGSAAGVGYGLGTSASSQFYYPGDVVVETIVICPSDSDFGWAVVSHTQEVVRK